MTIYFANKTPIDLAAIEIMGVSVKDGPSPIGYFGTGLKFAIATLLRNGQKITLFREGQPYRFIVQAVQIRGQEFQRIHMMGPEGNERELGFTTQLGRNWELWQAFRELESNTRDENGQSGQVLSGEAWGTVFAVEGEAFEQVYRDKAKYFLASEAIMGNDSIQIHPLGPDPQAIFYRGVLAGKLPKPGLFTYNVLDGMLTEDRTLQSLWGAAWSVSLAAALDGAKRAITERVLLAPKGTWEQEALVNWPYSPGKVFDEVIQDHKGDPRLNRAAYNAWLANDDNEVKTFKARPVTAEMLRCAIKALAIVKRLGVDMGLDSFEVVEGLGENTYGLARKGKIYISSAAFDLGHRFLASTLYEEHLHNKEGLSDESRAMQNWLFERLASMTERCMELEAGLPGEEQIVLRTTMPLAPTAKMEVDDEIPF